MDSQRNLLFIAWLFVCFLVWQTWNSDQQASQLPSSQQAAVSQITPASGSADHVITVKTDVLQLAINLQGGDITDAQLLTYPASLDNKTPFQLLETTPDFIYQAQSGLTGKDGIDNPDNGSRPVYQASAAQYQLADGQQTLTVPISYTATNGVKYQKVFTFKRGEYGVDVAYHIDNQSQSPLQLAMFGQLKQTVELPKVRDNSSHNFALHTYRGAAFSSDDEKYKKYSFSDIEDKHLDESTAGGWVAMLQQYFVSAWVPHGNDQHQLYSRNLGDGVAAIGYKSANVTVPAGANQQLSATLWVGPELQDKMAAVAPHLDMTVDYGWLWFLSQPLFKLLKFIHSFIGNWGFSIIIITFIVRGIMYPLTKAQYTSMAKMRMLQPKIQAMRERFGEDKQRMSQEMMALYKKEKVNPLGGCFPVIIQMPIFLALYYMLMASVELRHAPFILWIRDLAAQDPYYILPILMGLTMYFIQKLSPAAVTDPMQQKIMNFMPVIFTVFFLWFPSGLVLYYIVSNLVTIIQQQLIYRGLEKRGLHSRQKKSANS